MILCLNSIENGKCCCQFQKSFHYYLLPILVDLDLRHFRQLDNYCHLNLYLTILDILLLKQFFLNHLLLLISNHHHEFRLRHKVPQNHHHLIMVFSYLQTRASLSDFHYFDQSRLLPFVPQHQQTRMLYHFVFYPNQMQ